MLIEKPTSGNISKSEVSSSLESEKPQILEQWESEKMVREKVEAVISRGEHVNFGELLKKFIEETRINDASSSVIREKLFWDAVAEGFKNNVFRKIQEEIVESGDTSESFINSKIKEAINKFGSLTIDQRNFAFLMIKPHFYRLFPELEKTAEKTKLPQGELSEEVKQDWVDNHVKTTLRRGIGPVNRQEVKRKTQRIEIPIDKIKPGLCMEIYDKIEDTTIFLKVLSEPERSGFLKSGPLEVDTKWTLWIGPGGRSEWAAGYHKWKKERFKLEDLGIIPHQANRKFDNQKWPVSCYL